jgi:hypothetical protein
MPIFILVLFLVIFGFLIWASLKQEKLRRISMMQVAKEMNLDFSETDTFGLMKQLRMFHFFSHYPPYVLGFSNGIQNVVSGALEDTDVFLFDHNYHTKSGRDRNVSQTSFVAILKDPNTPGFRYQHDCWYQMKLINRHRMQGKQGPIVFREELVNWDETEALVREKLIPELQPFLTAEDPANIELREGCLLIYKPEISLGTENAIAFFQDCCALTALLQSKQNRKPLYRWAEIQEKDY